MANSHTQSGIALQYPFPPLFEIGKLGYIPKLPKHGKLSPLSRTGRYMGIHDIKTVVVQTEDGINHRVRDTEFNPIYPHTDPTKTHKMTFESFADRLRHVWTQIVPDATPPINISHAHRYPDKNEWCVAHDQALAKLEAEQVIDWTATVPLDTRLIPLTMYYHHKWLDD